MSKITRDEVEKIAKLARIELNEREKAKFSRELSEIFTFVEKLKKVQTTNLEETSQVTGLENVYRKDLASELTHADKNSKKNQEIMMKNAPQKKDNYWRVNKVLE